jgi:hypothetical protein
MSTLMVTMTLMAVFIIIGIVNATATTPAKREQHWLTQTVNVLDNIMNDHTTTSAGSGSGANNNNVADESLSSGWSLTRDRWNDMMNVVMDPLPSLVAMSISDASLSSSASRHTNHIKGHMVVSSPPSLSSSPSVASSEPSTQSQTFPPWSVIARQSGSLSSTAPPSPSTSTIANLTDTDIDNSFINTNLATAAVATLPSIGMTTTRVNVTTDDNQVVISVTCTRCWSINVSVIVDTRDGLADTQEYTPTVARLTWSTQDSDAAPSIVQRQRYMTVPLSQWHDPWWDRSFYVVMHNITAGIFDASNDSTIPISPSPSSLNNTIIIGTRITEVMISPGPWCRLGKRANLTKTSYYVGDVNVSYSRYDHAQSIQQSHQIWNEQTQQNDTIAPVCDTQIFTWWHINTTVASWQTDLNLTSSYSLLYPLCYNTSRNLSDPISNGPDGSITYGDACARLYDCTNNATILVETDVLCVCPKDWTGWGCESSRAATCSLSLVYPDITSCVEANRVPIRSRRTSASAAASATTATRKSHLISSSGPSFDSQLGTGVGAAAAGGYAYGYDRNIDGIPPCISSSDITHIDIAVTCSWNNIADAIEAPSADLAGWYRDNGWLWDTNYSNYNWTYAVERVVGNQTVINTCTMTIPPLCVHVSCLC